MTRAVLFHAAGRPLDLVEFAAPEPTGPEVRVRITCCTLCRSDLHTHSGRRIEPCPTVLGHEIVGVIEAFGPDAPRHDASGVAVEVGSRVTWAVAVGCGHCFYCRHDLPQKCETPYKYGHRRTDPATPDGGGLADRITLVPNTVWYRVPDDIPDAVAAQANCATATAAAVVRAGGPVSGQTVLVFGAGVLGLTACAMARAGGATAVLVSDPLPAGRERANVFGATAATSPDELEAAVNGATAGRGADVVYELAGAASTVEAALKLVRVGGTVVLAGTVAPVGAVAFDPERAVRRMLTVRGVHNYHPRDLADALAFLAGAGRAYPWESLVVGRFPLAETEAAFAAAHARPGVRVAVLPEGLA